MSTERREYVENVGQQKRRVVEVEPSTQSVVVARVSQLVWLIFGVMTTVISFRLLLELLAANPNSGFVEFIYNLTDPMVSPFNGIMSNPQLTDSGSFLDMAAIFALIVYPIVAYIIVALFRIVFGDTGAVRSEYTRIDE